MNKPFVVFLLLLLHVLKLPVITAQKPLNGRDSSVKGPQSFAMIVGISKYRFVRPLNYADRDADLFSDFLRSPAGGALKESNIFELVNEQATAGNFWSKGFQWIKAKQLQKGDKLFIYLAGHGDAIDADQFFFLGFDCNPGSDKDNYLISGAIQLYNLKKKIADQTAKGVEVFFIMDACRSNELPGGTAGQNFLNTAVTQKKAGEIMMLAAEAGQESLEDASIGNGHGLFTYYLVDGLSGLADVNADNRVNFSEIRSYVNKNVPPLARQRFKREQVPFFCCEEDGNTVISNVDAAYLREWLRIKKTQSGNSVEENFPGPSVIKADTSLLNTYNRFYASVKKGALEIAEDYYRQLQKKFPGDPYTLDAQSTLAAEFINDAQININDYIGCASVSSRDKSNRLAAGKRLEKAMDLVKDYDPDYAASLRTRSLLLQALGTDDITAAFHYAWAIRSLEPNTAYVNNCLALLHMGRNRDSALYYAEKAARRAPNWPCALNTLAKARELLNTPPQKDSIRKIKRGSLGFTLGGGINSSRPDYQPSPNSTILGASGTAAGFLNIGLLYHASLSDRIALRPSLQFSYGNTNIYFDERNPVGGNVVRTRIDIRNSSLFASLPLIIRFPSKAAASKNPVPYITAGPSFIYNLNQDDPSNRLLPIKNSLFLGQVGFGLEFKMAKTGIVLSPEISYAAGLTDMKESSANTNYSNSLNSLKRSQFMAGIYLRKGR